MLQDYLTELQNQTSQRFGQFSPNTVTMECSLIKRIEINYNEKLRKSTAQVEVPD